MMNLKKYTQKDKDGNMFSYEFDVPAMQGVPKPEGKEVDPSIFKAKGTDTEPAMLTIGENVVNAEASRKYQPLIDQMNNEGRAIQQMQGGPIPSYAADGGQVGKPTGRQTIVGRDIYDAGNKGFMSEQGMTIPTQEGYYNVPSIHNGIQYNEDQLERMVNDGVIPMPTSFYQNQDNAIAASIMRSRALNGQNVMGMEHTQPRYEADGGQVPMYSAAGDFVIDDTMLDAVSQVESNNNPQALSDAGAGGQYQIMPATAQQPGYGTTPISLEDRTDPVKARQFAKDYLIGIKRKHPDFSRDQLVTAYHSGVGNVLKSINGTEELGPNGQAYAGKVNAAMGEIPNSELANMYPQGGNYGSRDSDNKGFFETYFPKTSSRLDITKKEADRESAKRGLDSDNFLPFNPTEGDTILGIRIGRDGLNETNEDIAELNKEIASQGDYVNPSDVKKLEALLKKRKELEVLVQEQIEFKKEAYKPTATETSAKESYEKLDVPKVINDKNKKPTPEVKAIIQDIVKKTTSSVVIPEKDLAEEGEKKKDEDPELFERVQMEMSKFFDLGEVVRASLVYLGSRVLGYDHGGSLNFVGVNYLKRLDSKQAAAEKFASSERATKAFEQGSLKDFVESGGDRDKLIPLSKPALKVKGGYGTALYDKKTGASVDTFKMNDKDETVMVRLQGSDGKFFEAPMSDPRVRDRVTTLVPDIHNDNKIRERFTKTAIEQIKSFNGTKEDDDSEYLDPKFATQLANKASGILRRTMRGSEIQNTAARAQIIEQINTAMNDVFSLKKSNPKTTSDALEKLFEARIASVITNGVVSYPDIEGFEKRFQELNQQIENIAGRTKVPAGQNRNTVQTNVYRKLWGTFKNVWDQYSALDEEQIKNRNLPKVFIGAGQEEVGYNDFLNWVDKFLKGNPDAAKLMALRKE